MLRILTLLVFCLAPISAFSQSYIFFSDVNNDTVERSSLDGANRQIIIPDLEVPRAIDLDLTNNKIYWADSSTDSIARADLNGGNVEIIITGLDLPAGIALDVGNEKIYWSDGNLSKIQRANFDGSMIEDVITVAEDPGMQDPRWIDLDIASGKIYWTDLDANEIRRANLDGTSVEVLLDNADLNNPHGLSLDLVNGKFYFSDSSAGTDFIARADLDGSNFETIVTGLDNPRGVFADAASGKVYWTDIGSDLVQRANLDGTTVETVSSAHNNPQDVVLNVVSNKLFWLSSGSDCIHTANPDGSGPSEVLVDANNARNVAVDQINNNVVFITDTSSDVIVRTGIDGANPETIITDLDTSINNPRGIAYDPDNDHIYWSDRADNTIKRANSDGSMILTILDGGDGLTNPEGVAVSGGKLYWVDDAGATNHVSRANLDGSSIEVLVTGLTGLRDVAVDAANGKVYWSDINIDEIQRSDLDGMNVETIVNGLNNPFGLAIDSVAGKVYWSESGAVEVKRADNNALNSNIESLINTDLSNPIGIALLIDITPPAAPIITSPVDAFETNNALFDVIGTAEANSTVEVFDNLISLGTTVTDASGNWTFTLGANYSDGAHSFTATATDTASNTGAASDAINVTVDTTAPVAPSLMTTSGAISTRDSTPALSGTAEAGSTVEIFVDGNSAGTVVADADGNWSFEVPSQISSGEHNLTAVATDSFGNSSTSSISFSLIIITDCLDEDKRSAYLELDGAASRLLDLLGATFITNEKASSNFDCNALNAKKQRKLSDQMEQHYTDIWESTWLDLPPVISECSELPEESCTLVDTTSFKEEIRSDARKMHKKIRKGLGNCGKQLRRGKRLLVKSKKLRNTIFQNLDDIADTVTVC